MTSNITSNTNFNNLTITNDYPCLVGGTWTASKGSDGQTVYSNGTISYKGPVNLIGGTLTVLDGAVVSDLVAVNSPTITVNSGGILQNSDVFAATLTINAGGLSQNNNYVSSAVKFIDNSTTSGDYFYYPGVTGTKSGTLNLSQLPTGTVNTFQTSKGVSSFWTGVSWATSVIIKDPHFPDISANNTTAPTAGTQTIFLGPGCQFGNTKLAPTTDYSNGKFTLTNDNKTYIGGVWTASLNSEGKTVYSNGTVTVEGPINLINAASLTINAGAVVDGLTFTSTGSAVLPINNSGTIQNSFVANGYLYNLSGGVSKNNTYVSEVYWGRAGSTTSGDMFYSGIATSYATYNFSQMPTVGAVKQFILDDGVGNIYLYKGSQWDNSYAGTNVAQKSSQIYIYRDFGSDVACFLSGTMIKTQKGYIAVEDIQIGEQILTYNDSKQEIKSIVWKGYNTVTVNPNLDEDKAGYPIRILKNAIDENVPSKDLLITPEHCLFIDNQFIPAYMLVNGCSIYYDHSINQYTYYHIETEQHSIINADGMLTESYLDTGNRHAFYQDHEIINIHNKNKSWEQDAAAPLVTTREVVEPVFNKILQRIEQLGLTYISNSLSTTNDSNLYLITDCNEIIEKASQNKEKFIFRIPSNTKYVRLVSRTSKPSNIIGPYIGDRRDLGVLVSNITLLNHRNVYKIDIHLTNPNIPGWDKEMQKQCRWTNGDAFLEMPKTDNETIGILIINVLAGGPYLLNDAYENEVQLKHQAI